MARFQFESDDPFRSFGYALAIRPLLFFASGWLGILVVRFAIAFNQWSAFLSVIQVTKTELRHSTFGYETFAFFAWPFFWVAGIGRHSVLLAIAATLFLVYAFFKFVFDDIPHYGLILSLAFLVQGLVLIREWQELTASSLLILGIFWTGLGAAGWWTLQVNHPEFLEKATGFFKGRTENGNPESKL